MYSIHATAAASYRARNYRQVPPLAIMTVSQLQLPHLLPLGATIRHHSITQPCTITWWLDTQTFISSFRTADIWFECVRRIGKQSAPISLKVIWFEERHPNLLCTLYSLYHVIDNNKHSLSRDTVHIQQLWQGGSFGCACSKGLRVMILFTTLKIITHDLLSAYSTTTLFWMHERVQMTMATSVFCLRNA